MRDFERKGQEHALEFWPNTKISEPLLMVYGALFGLLEGHLTRVVIGPDAFQRYDEQTCTSDWRLADKPYGPQMYEALVREVKVALSGDPLVGERIVAHQTGDPPVITLVRR